MTFGWRPLRTLLQARSPRCPARSVSLVLVFVLLAPWATAQERATPDEPASAEEPRRAPALDERATAIEPERTQATAIRNFDLGRVDQRNVLHIEAAVPRDLQVLERGTLRKLPPGTEEVQLRPNQLFVSRLGAEATQVDTPEAHSGDLQWRLPYEVLGVDQAGNPYELQPIVRVDGGGMRPQPGGGFLGRIFAGVRDANRPDQRHPLASSIEILVTGEVDEVEPRTIALERTNSYQEVLLRAASPRDSVKMQLSPTFHREGTEIELPVLRGSLQLSVSPPRIQGLGLQTAQVLVQATGLPSFEGLTVALSTDSGSLDDNRLSLDSGGFASTTLRSITTGVAAVQARASGLVPAKEPVRFLFPWLFLGAAVVGGLVGSLIRWARTEDSARRSLWIELLVLGVLVGLVVASAYSIGINLLPFEPKARAGEALVFVLAALGAFFGIPKGSAAKG